MRGPQQCFNLIISLLILLAFDTSFAVPDFAACGDLPHDKIEVPGGVQILRLHARGTRNYTCSTPGGQPIIADNQGGVLAHFHPEGKENETAGFAYTDPDDDVIMILDYPLGNLSGSLETNVTLAGAPVGTSPIFQPSPRNDSIPWARWRVIDAGGTGVLENVTYVTRYDTEGGKKPETCPAGKLEAQIPFKAAYSFYTCTQSNGFIAAVGSIKTALLSTSFASILLILLT